MLTFGQKLESGDWAKVAAHYAGGNDNLSPVEVGRYMQCASMAALITERIFFELTGQVAITRGQEISCKFSRRSRLL